MPTNNPNQPTSSQPTPRGAAEAASNRIEQGGRRVESGIEKLEKGAEAAASTALNRVREAREQASSGLAEQRDHVADRIRRVGVLLRSGSETLAADDPFAKNVLSYVGDTAESLSEYVRGATPSTVSQDLQSFARRRPGVFFGSAFLIGLAMGRFVKSSTSSPSGGGGGRNDADSYGDGGDESLEYRAAYASSGDREAPAAVAPSYTGTSTGGSSSQTAPTAGTSLPYVSAGNTLGATPSSASYGASTSAGTGSGPDTTAPSYGSATVGGTSGYAPQSGSSTAPVVTRPSQPPAARDKTETPASPRPRTVREGEGTKS